MDYTICDAAAAHLPQLAALERYYCFLQQFRAHFGQSVEQFSGSLVFTYFSFFLQQNVARIQPNIRKHGGNASYLFAVYHSPLYRRGSSVFGQQTGVYVYAALLRHVKIFAAEYLPKGCRYHKFGRFSLQRGNTFFAFYLIELINLHAVF